MHRSRRNALKTLGALGALGFVRCTTGGTTTSPDASTVTDAGTKLTDAAAASTDGAISASSFATGDGSFLATKDYGNPFASGMGSTCTAYPASTKGPCHSNTFLRKDITDGLVGLPTRFDLLVVNASCQPVAGAIVEVWYASPTGTYSEAAQAIDAGTDYGGSLSDLNVGFCTGNDPAATSASWLRGYQTTGSDGRVIIDGIFPGWYSGRTTHVHFIVTANGQQYVTSQLFFAETLTTAVYTKHATYAPHGNKDTSNASDMVASANDLASIGLVSYAQQSDGALLCWKAITVAA